jgi:hypothetical protein
MEINQQIFSIILNHIISYSPQINSHNLMCMFLLEESPIFINIISLNLYIELLVSILN